MSSLVPQLPALRHFWVMTQGMGELVGSPKACEVRGWPCESREVKAPRAYRRERSEKREQGQERESLETQRGPGGVSNIQHIGTAGKDHLKGCRETLLLTQTQGQNPLHQPDERTRIQEV